MTLRSNDDVETPDGPGILIGQTPSGKLAVRLRQRKDVPSEQKAKTFNGWQFEYDQSQVKPAPVNGKKK